MIPVPTERDLERVKRHLTEMGAGALGLYKGPCFERRLASRLRVHGFESVDAYADLLDRDRDERDKLLSALAIGVTSFFRNPPAWRRLAELIEAANPVTEFAVWSAGCSTGEETYSAGMMLGALARKGAVGGWSVVGTDVDDRSLSIARAGEYPIRVVAEIDVMGDEIARGGNVDDGRFRVGAEVRAGTTFRRDDLIGSPPRSLYRLVICRNVLIYFGAEGQTKAIDNLVRALEPGGLLMLGKAELAAAGPDLGLELIDRRERIYRRIG